MLARARIGAWHLAAITTITTIAVGIALVAASAEASKRPVSAGVPLAAPLQEPISAYDGYEGWGQVAHGFFASAAAQPPIMAFKLVEAPYPQRSYWVQRSRFAGERVYIAPLGYEGWSWTWTSRTGWYAMETHRLTIGYQPIAVAT